MNFSALACRCCGQTYFPQSVAWGDACGECIAAEVELILMDALSMRERRPMKRAADLADYVDLPTVRRAVGGR